MWCRMQCTQAHGGTTGSHNMNGRMDINTSAATECATPYRVIQLHEVAEAPKDVSEGGAARGHAHRNDNAEPLPHNAREREDMHARQHAWLHQGASWHCAAVQLVPLQIETFNGFTGNVVHSATFGAPNIWCSRNSLVKSSNE